MPGDPGAIVAGLVGALRRQIHARGTGASAPAAGFDAMVRAESNMPVLAAANRFGMTSGLSDRFVCRHFGHPPKTVLRRSRFLDMAGVIRGVASPDVDAIAPVRFYDASHLNREFREFIGMTPGSFALASPPLLDAGLAGRQWR